MKDKDPFKDVPESYRLGFTRNVHDRRVMMLLHLREVGPVSDASGQVTTLLAEALGVNVNVVQSDLVAMEHLVRRERNVKRTFEVDLNDDGRRLLSMFLGEGEAEEEVIDVTDDSSPSISDEPEESGSGPGLAPTPEAVADALLAKVLAQVDGHDRFMEDLQEKVQRLENRAKEATTTVTRLNRRIAELEGELSETRSIENSLRRQLGQANERVGQLQGSLENLRQHQRGGARIKQEDREALARIMTGLPKGPSNG